MAGRLMIVDDNRALAEDLGEILEEEGYTVEVFDDPAEVLARRDQLDFDVALLDIRMPEIDGVALHAELARDFPKAAFVLMTAYTEDDRVAVARAAGVRTVLPKPVPMDRLLQAFPPPDELGERVLVVEDDASMGASFEEMLAEAGYRTELVGTLAQARAAIARSAPAAAVLDVRLPDGAGTELASDLGHLDTVVVLVTGYSPEDAERAVKEELQGRGKVLTKPFSPDNLLAVLKELRGAQS